MKHWLALIFILSLLAGCDMNQESNTAAKPAEKEELASKTPTRLIEYVWNKEGPNFSEEKLIELTQKWNARIDAGQYDMWGANILRPQFESEDFDFIWVLIWPSSETRDAAWADWSLNQDADWRNETKDIFDYAPEDVYGFESRWGYQSSNFDISVGQTFEPSFSFCAFNEGFDRSNLDTLQTKYNDWLDEDSAGNTQPYAYTMLDAQFEQDNIDFVWLDLFLNEDDKQAGQDSWSGTDLEKEWNELATCQNFQFTATAIRR